LEITKSLDVEVSAPKPSKATISEGRAPSVFLVYNLTHEQIQFLLQQGVWSSQTITFRVLPFSPPCPNFLFSIRGFSTHTRETIFPIIQQIWDDNETRDYSTLLINAVLEDKKAETEAAMCLFFDSMWVQRLDIK